MAYIRTENEAGIFHVIGEFHRANVPFEQFQQGAKAILKEAIHYDAFNSLGAFVTGDRYAFTTQSRYYRDRVTTPFANQNDKRKVGLAEPVLKPAVWVKLYEDTQAGVMDKAALETRAGTAARKLLIGFVEQPIEIRRSEPLYQEVASASELLLDAVEGKRKNIRNLLMAQTGVALARKYQELNPEIPAIDLVVGSAHMIGVSQALELADEERVRLINQDPQFRRDYDLTKVHERLLAQPMVGGWAFIAYGDPALQRGQR